MCNNQTVMFQRNNAAEDPDRGRGGGNKPDVTQLKIMLKFALYMFWLHNAIVHYRSPNNKHF